MMARPGVNYDPRVEATHKAASEAKAYDNLYRDACH